MNQEPVKNEEIHSLKSQLGRKEEEITKLNEEIHSLKNQLGLQEEEIKKLNEEIHSLKIQLGLKEEEQEERAHKRTKRYVPQYYPGNT